MPLPFCCVAHPHAKARKTSISFTCRSVTAHLSTADCHRTYGSMMASLLTADRHMTRSQYATSRPPITCVPPISHEIIHKSVHMDGSIDLEKDIRTNDSKSSLRASFHRFEELILRHAVDRPPWTTGILCPKDISAITDYVATRQETSLSRVWIHWSFGRLVWICQLLSCWTEGRTARTAHDVQCV